MKSRRAFKKVERIIESEVISSPEKTTMENLKIPDTANTAIIIIEERIITALDQFLNFHNPKAIAAKRAAHNP